MNYSLLEALRELNEIWDVDDNTEITPGDIIYGRLFQQDGKINLKDNHANHWLLVLYTSKSKDVFYGFQLQSKMPKDDSWLKPYVTKVKGWKDMLLAGPTNIYISRLKNVNRKYVTKIAGRISRQDQQDLLNKLKDVKNNPDRYPMWNGTEQENYLDRVIYAVQHLKTDFDPSGAKMLWTILVDEKDVERYKAKHPDIKYEDLEVRS